MLEKSTGSPSATDLDAAAKKYFAGLKSKQGKPPFASFDEFLLKTTFGPKIPTGRAPYARPVLKQVVAEILAGFDATKACKAADPEKGEHKSENGALYDLGIPFHKVSSSLASLKSENAGMAPRLLRNGTLIHVATGTWAGQWRILSVKNSEA